MNIAAGAPGISLIIESAGAHKFSYAKIENTTGETVWRWPNEPPNTERTIRPTGDVVDVRV